jgi:hypothetical protein
MASGGVTPEENVQGRDPGGALREMLAIEGEEDLEGGAAATWMAPVIRSYRMSALRDFVRGMRSAIEVAEEYSILRVRVWPRSLFEGDTMIDVEGGRLRNQARSRGSREREPLRLRSVRSLQKVGLGSGQAGGITAGMKEAGCVGGLGVVAVGSAGGAGSSIISMEPSSSREGAKLMMDVGIPEMGSWRTAVV